MAPMLVTLVIAIFATAVDLKTRKIPNYITLPSIALGLLLQIYLLGFKGFESSLLGIAIGVLFLFAPFALGFLGAGDVKLLATVGAINGATFTFYTFLYGAIAGGILAIGYVIIQRQSTLAVVATTSILRNVPTILRGHKDLNSYSSGIKFPYGIAILAGTIATYVLR